MSYNTLVHGVQGGAEFVIEEGGTLTVDGDLDITGGITIDTKALPTTVTFTPGAGSSNVCEVVFAVKDSAGNTIAKAHSLELYLSDAAAGIHTTTTASGAVGMKASNGVDLATYVSKKHLRVLTKADGTGTLSITDSSKTGFYVNAIINGLTSTSAQLVTGNYG